MAGEGKHHDELPQEEQSAGLNPWRDIALVIMFLTRLPVPVPGHATRPLGSAAWAFPFAGILTGGVGGGAFFGAIRMGLPLTVAVMSGLAASIVLSGALHEDGLADAVDGFGGGTTREKKLEIMRDSHIGAYGVLALIFSVGLRTAALAAIAAQNGPQTVFAAFLAAGIFTRGLLPGVMVVLPHARRDGLSKNAGRPGVAGTIVSVSLGIIGAVAAFHSGYQAVVIPMLGAVGAALVLCLIAWRQIGGQTGDTIGAAQQVSEITFLIGLSITLGAGS